MDILLALLYILTFNIEPMNVTLKEDNVYTTDKYPIIIKTLNCEEPANNDLAYVTYSENDIYTPKQIQFVNGHICQISSIEEKPWFQG